MIFNQNKQNDPTYSPNFLGNGAKRGIGVRRLNRMPLIIAVSIGVLIAGSIGYTYQNRIASNETTESTDNDGQKAEPSNATTVLEKAPTAGMIEANPSKLPPLEPDAHSVTLPKEDTPKTSTPDPYQQAQYQQWEQHQQELNQVEQARQSTWQSALGSGTTIFTGEGKGDPSALQGKIDYQGLGTQNTNYLPGRRMPAISPYEIKAGTVIPSVMISGINSQLPGQLIAQVSENVYDTATGKYLLIPQGSKLVGTYDNQVVSGQKRVLIVWSRLIYPDASSLDLGAMSGTDQAGYAGFQDRINNHMMATFRTALFLSAITAGIQLSQPQASLSNAYNAQQIIAGSLGQQMGQLGMSTIQKGLNIAPTITIRPGYHFNVMTNKDVVLPLWQG